MRNKKFRNSKKKVYSKGPYGGTPLRKAITIPHKKKKKKKKKNRKNRKN